MEADLTRTTIEGVEHWKLCSHDRKFWRKAEQPRYDNIWPPHLLIGPNSALPNATVHSKIPIDYVPNRHASNFPVWYPGPLRTPLRPFLVSLYHTQVWGGSYDSQPSSILTPPPRLLARLLILPCIIPIRNDDDDESILVYACYWNVLIRIKNKGKVLTDRAGSYNVHSSSFNDSKNRVDLKRNDSLNFTNKLVVTLNKRREYFEAEMG